MRRTSAQPADEDPDSVVKGTVSAGRNCRSTSVRREAMAQPPGTHLRPPSKHQAKGAATRAHTGLHTRT